jgi:probable addiction module antidote protein
MIKHDELELAPFDASDYLDNEATIAEYLSVALEDPDPDAFLTAVRDVAKARGIADVAARAGLGRESMYKTLSPGAKPRFETMQRLLAALDVRIDVSVLREKPVS